MLKAIYDTINRRKSKELVNAIESGFSDLKDEIKEMFDDETKIGKPDLITSIVEKTFEFNRQKQEGQGTKILTSDQMLSRLPISLAQLKAENNSENLKMK